MRKATTHFGLAALGLLGFQGCHSAFVQATVTNQSGKPIRLFEVDYPNASFGSGELAPGAVFRYRFKVLGDGSVKVTWTDLSGTDHTAKGPELREGAEGRLGITLGSNAAQWDPQVH